MLTVPFTQQTEGGGVARIRSIKPEFPQSESLGRVSREARLLFINLWTICDDEGRTRAASRLLASLLYPYDADAPALIDGWLEELAEVGAVRRYTVDRSTYLDIPNWSKHQKIDKPGKSRLPAFDEDSRMFARIREESTTDLGSRILDLGSRTGEPATVVASSPERPRQSPHSQPSNLINGAYQREHGTHAFCSVPRRKGLCVPADLHAEFMDKALKSSNELRAFYAATLDRFAVVPVGEDRYVFWRREFSAWIGMASTAAVAARPDRAERIYTAAEKVIARQMAAKELTDGR